MVETNVRILAPGAGIALPVRSLRVEMTHDAPDLREKICYRLREEYGLVALPAEDKRQMLLVASEDPVTSKTFTVDEWPVTLTDMGATRLLTFTTPEQRSLLASFVERMMNATLAKHGEWRNYGSPRHWYERDPFKTEQIRVGGAEVHIQAYRRYALSAIAIEGVGVGIAVDVETAFFSQESVAYFFSPEAARSRQEAKHRLFDTLRQRQKGHKGTLLYDTGEKMVNCYFASILEGRTCGNTETRRVRGKQRCFLADYYRQKYPSLSVRSDDMVALVSFPSLKQSHPLPVAARHLRLRVNNEVLPSSLAIVDKIAPGERRQMITDFWKRLGMVSFPQVRSVVAAEGFNEREISTRNRPNATKGLEAGLLTSQSLPPIPQKREQETIQIIGETFLKGFWRPWAERVRGVPFPVLTFGKGERLEPPHERTPEAYGRYFRRRGELLADAGCYDLPATTERTLCCAYPVGDHLDDAAEEMIGNLCQRLEKLTGKAFEYRLISYDSLETAVDALNQERTGTVVFVLDGDSIPYAQVALDLPDWRVKRVMKETLRRKYNDLTVGARSPNGGNEKERGKNSWDSFVRMITLDTLQKMDGVAFRIDKAGPFDAQFIVDVSHDWRYYGLSLLIAREGEKRSSFRILTDTFTKADVKAEAINGTVLRDQIIKTIPQWALNGNASPLSSLLLVRDGKLCGEEEPYLREAVKELKRRGVLTPDARTEIVELHKKTEMHLRLWEIDARNNVSNVMEGTAVQISATQEVLATTGEGTLRQGTAELMLIVAPSGGDTLTDATDALAASAQLNWWSPSVAQRLPTPIKRTDEELIARAEQEIRGLK